MENTFSEYTRAQAIEDGVLVDVSKLAKESGIIIPIAITSTLFELVDYNRWAQSTSGRLWDIFVMLKLEIKRKPGASILFFDVLLVGGSKKKSQILKAVASGGDHGEPVITIMYPEED